MQTERPPGRFSISAGFVSVRVTAVHRRDFHAPTVSQQADYTSGQQPRRSSPPPPPLLPAHLAEITASRSSRA